MDLSIIFGSFNRLDALEQCLGSIPAAVGDLDYEIVITDGGSTDGTLELLRNHPKVKLIEHGALYGPVKAYNDGFALAQGEYVAYLNDDLILLPGVLKKAVDILRRRREVGVVSLPYTSAHDPQSVIQLVISKPAGERGWPVASFGVLRRADGERVGWFGPWFYHYHGDSHLCLAITEMGKQVISLGETACHHLRRNNAVRGFAWPIPGAKARSQYDGFLLRLLWGGWEGPGVICDGLDPALMEDLKDKENTVVYSRDPGELEGFDILPRHGWGLYTAIPKEPKPVG